MPRSSNPLSLAERAAQLPAPEPGKVVSGPLELLPEWLKLHNRVITGFDEKRSLFKGQRRPTPQEQPHDHE